MSNSVKNLYCENIIQKGIDNERLVLSCGIAGTEYIMTFLAPGYAAALWDIDGSKNPASISKLLMTPQPNNINSFLGLKVNRSGWYKIDVSMEVEATTTAYVRGIIRHNSNKAGQEGDFEIEIFSTEDVPTLATGSRCLSGSVQLYLEEGDAFGPEIGADGGDVKIFSTDYNGVGVKSPFSNLTIEYLPNLSVN